jgi:hypothetical protein
MFFEDLLIWEIGAIHGSATLLSAICVWYAVKLIRKHNKAYAKFKKARIGDHVDFSMFCEYEECTMQGVITRIEGDSLEIKADPATCGLRECTTCLANGGNVGREYHDVQF